METLDSRIKYDWADHSEEGLRLIQASFQIDDGLFKVEFKNPSFNPGIWELSFVRNHLLDLTGTGNAHRVMATVMAITREFIRDVDPKVIEFAAKNTEASRNKLYPRLLSMLHREFPHYIKNEPRGGNKYTTYQLERPAKPFVAPEKPQPVKYDPVTDEEWADIEAMLGPR